MTPRTIVFFHAHPDDESLISAGTIARAVDAGPRVIRVLATDGGAGTADQSILDDGEDLADRRRREAAASAAALGAQLEFLGYADSGMAPSPGWPKGSFAAAALSEATDRLCAILRTEQAAMLVADDSVGGYGHADHLKVHQVALAASRLAGIPLLEVTIDREFLSGGIELASSLGLEVPDGFVPPDMSNWYTPHADITHTVDVSGVLDRKRASMQAHTTQASGASADSVRTLAVFLGLPEDIFAIAFATEWFIAAEPIPTDLAELFAPVAP